MVEVDCAHCGATFERAQHRVDRAENSYCDRDCVVSAQREHRAEAECAHCGETFERRVSRLEGVENAYCDIDCYGIGKRERVEVECAHCGETLKRQVGRVEDVENTYCDMECKIAALPDRVEVECGYCGETLERIPSSVRRSKNQFCDNVCQAQWLSENYTGEGAPNWTGGCPTYLGPRWDDKRKQILRRDNHQCALCGLSNDGHKALYGRELSVHHMTPRDECQGWEEANSAENLLTTCLVCHCRIFDAGYSSL